MELGISKLLKRYAKIIGEPTVNVRKVWDRYRTEMIQEGFDPKDSQFLLMLTERVKQDLGIQEDYVCLDKFKKFL